MKHIFMVLEDKEVVIFYDSCFQDRVPAALEAILRHLSNSRIRSVFDQLGLVNVTDREATLYSLDGDMVSVAL